MATSHLLRVLIVCELSYYATRITGRENTIRNVTSDDATCTDYRPYSLCSPKRNHNPARPLDELLPHRWRVAPHAAG